ncbi:hypothetical protein Phum_PHUM076800 [Pediculus humanus corporis]|uniref:Death domain-containing protein n=1 Tax=Pediculus humanus subsp. corporis TaxID=121224 RepID=E0VC14_PEDHC|nr:uncharacterized protein Phum_PHUM076800 [Pediculus humanus corporis]EEB10920.1 hypothetical protein Phum_PHUM076800 [Pediculus humanus corporis]
MQLNGNIEKSNYECQLNNNLFQFQNKPHLSIEYLEDESVKEIRNTKKSISLINVNNGKYFNIGSQTTINVNEFLVGKLNSLTSSSVEWNQLMNCDDKLTEDIIKLIALNYSENWKSLGKNLGFNSDVVNEIEIRNVNKTFMVYHTLKVYLKMYPNTSIGFIANILKKNCQFLILNKLLKIKN